MRCIQAASLAAFFAPALLAVTGLVAEAQNPYTSAEDIQEGRRFFELDCASCHGGDARGGRGPDLTRGTFRHATNDQQLFQVVRFGIQGTEMPSRARTDPRAWRVVAYLRSLGGGGELPPGDPARGEEIFFGPGTCSTCHMVDGEGSMQGPDLTAIGYQRSADHLRSSILDPDAELDPRWWGAQVTTLDGSRPAATCSATTSTPCGSSISRGISSPSPRRVCPGSNRRRRPGCRASTARSARSISTT